jgi:CBS-domain-containing membrane protein
MKVREVMSNDVETCLPSTSLTDAAMAMWRRDCGIVPVLRDGSRKIAGVVTDRDICIATATRHVAPERITVKEVMQQDVITCRPDEDVHDALDRMRQSRVRRLPVIDSEENVVGILSLNDMVRRAEPAGKRGRPGVSSEDVLATLKAICAPRTEIHAELQLVSH